MFITKMSLPRRTFLRGMGVTLALPLLDSMVPALTAMAKTAAAPNPARRFGAIKDRQGRRLVFMTFSGEESGLLGSRHYCTKEPLFALEDTAAMVNLDMVGRLRPDKTTQQDRLIVEGVGSAKEFGPLIDKLNPGFTYTKRQGSGPYCQVPGRSPGSIARSSPE